VDGLRAEVGQSILPVSIFITGQICVIDIKRLERADEWICKFFSGSFLSP
jgi:hypothetical protein